MRNLFLALIALFAFTLPAQAKEAPTAYVIKVQDIITPATSDFIHRQLQLAAEEKASVFVIELDTPGGLMDSMKAIIQDILASNVPVATYVSPSGAHAASAGTYIMYASHIAAMAPSTNLGAATPIMMGEKNDPKDTLSRKMISDASAYIRGLAELRKRNSGWAEQAVNEAVSLSASEALQENVIDVVARNPDELMDKIDGRVVKVNNADTTLHTRGAKIEFHEPDWRNKLLSIITNPNITFLLTSIGAYGIILEFSHPGAFFPGILGAICLLLGLYAMNVLPINYAGLGLIVLGIGCMTAEAFMPTFGVLGIGGAAAFAIGASILINSDIPGFGISPWLIAGMTLCSLGLLSVALTFVLRSRKRPVTTGTEAMTGASGEVVDWHQTDGEVRIVGTIWKAKSSTAYILKKGDRIKVLKVDGLCLIIEPNR
jgi:membrane-bound serine protease (ClpP class)